MLTLNDASRGLSKKILNKQAVENQHFLNLDNWWLKSNQFSALTSNIGRLTVGSRIPGISYEFILSRFLGT